MDKHTKIIIVDDHQVVRQGISFVLKNNCPDVRLFEAARFQQLIDLLNQQEADLILLDINIPGGNSPAMIPKIKAIQPQVKILIFSAYEEDFLALRYIKAGVNGYLNKNKDEKVIINAVKKVLETGRFITPKLKEL